jgi:hypothetical protein
MKHNPFFDWNNHQVRGIGPASKHPCNQVILRWKAGLKQITSENYSLPFDMKLGHWIQPLHLKWQSFYWQWKRTLFRRVNNVWHQWEPISHHSTVAFR